MTIRKKMSDRLDFESIHNSDEAESDGDISNHSDSTNNSEEKIGDDTEHAVLNSGWVDSISKILKAKKPKRKKTVVLSKAKKLTDPKKKKLKPLEFEVETIDGEIKEEKIDTLLTVPFSEPPRKKKRDSHSLRVKPHILERDKEKALQKIATKGVVQLFNAVKNQQKEISDKLKEAGPLEAKKEKILKNLDKKAFLDVLMGERSQKVEVQTKRIKEVKKIEPEKDTTWSVLKDDFMMTAKMKDWDRDMDVVEESIDPN